MPERLGDFAIRGVLGEGGSGVVYAASWGPREVALKVLRPELVASPRERERFLAEARLLGEIGHPGVVKVLAAGVLDDGRPFLAMEKLDGECLSARLQRGALAPADALRLFDQLASAVTALHDRGQIHRDLKPENVFLVRGEAHVVLLDFGIAKDEDTPASTVTQQGGVRGTPAYMAPERFFGQPAGPLTDVYELAVVLCAMLTGRLPWDDTASPAERLDPRRLSALGAQVPAALDAVVARALSTRPEQRPAGAAELRALVAASAGGEGDGRVTLDLVGDRSRRDSAGAVVASAAAPLDARVTPAELALAPTVAAVARRSRRRWLGVGVVGAVVVALVALAAAVAVRGRGRGVAVLAAVPTLPAAGPAAAVAPPRTLRTGDDHVLFGVGRHFGADVKLVLAVRFRELRQSPALIGLFDQAKASPTVATLNIFGGMCGIDLIEDLDWFAVASGPIASEADVAVAGAWTRAEIEACLDKLGAQGGVTAVVPVGRLTRLERKLGAPLWLGWLDDRTFLASSRARQNQRWMEERLDGKRPLVRQGHFAALFAALDTERSVWAVGDIAALFAAIDESWPRALPRPVLAAASLAVTREVDLAARLRYRDAAAATAARAELDRALGEKVDPVTRAFLGHLELDQHGPDVVLSAHLDEGVTTLLSRSLAERATAD